MRVLGCGRYLKGFVELARFILTKYGPVASHGNQTGQIIIDFRTPILYPCAFFWLRYDLATM